MMIGTKNGTGAMQGVNRLNETSHGEVTTRWELVTPETAASWLKSNTQNRRLMPALAARYAADMAAGRWLTTHQGVAWTLGGTLADGQHRLEAIALAGRPQWILVTRGLPEAAVEALDRGKVRTVAHTLKILGYPISDRAVPIARQLYFGPAHSTGGRKVGAILTDMQIREVIDTHWEAICFAIGLGKLLGPSTVYAAIARAFYHASPESLTRFHSAALDQLDSDDRRPGDKTARLLKKVIDANTCGSSMVRVALYRKAQNAIAAYLSGIDLGKLYERTEDLFPLPKNTESAL